MAKKKVLLYFAGILFLLNIFAWQEVFVLADSSYLKVYFLDVGQGDAAFIETPGSRQILIDGGPDLSLLKKLQELMPFWDRSIDLVILTHPEKDHISGLIDVLKRYKVDYVLWTGIKRNTPEYRAWVAALNGAQKLNKTKLITDISKKEIKLGGALIDILYPFKNLTGQNIENTTNDTSIVSKIIFGENTFLFTGDITNNTEQELIAQKTDLTADVLKVAHHGSKYSTSDEFLEIVNPKIAVISAGRNNTYGHPTPEVLQRLEKFGIQIKRTDRDGDIKIISDGNNLELITKD